MLRHIASAGAAVGSALTVAILAAQTPQAPQTSQPARDTSAQQQRQAGQAAPAPTGKITGRVLAADTGRPIRAARVTLSGNQPQGGRSTSTDENGNFTFTALPEGRFTVSATKTGFVNASYGQRRAMQPGIPLQLAAGATLQNIDVRLPRGSAIEGHVYDENGEPAPATMVSVSRYQYVNGERRLQPAGSAQTDDRGSYRVWGLNPGDYYISAVVPNLGGLVGDVIGGLGGGRGRGGPGGAGGPGGPGGGGPGGGGGRGRGAAVGADGAADAGGGGAAAAGGGGRGGGGRGAAARGGIGAAAFGGADISGLMATATQVLGNVDLSALGNLGNLATLFSAQDPNGQVAYAPTYYPGVIAPAEARAVTVPLSGEALAIDFSLLLVRLSRITGHAIKPDGTMATAGNVTLVAEGQGGRGGPFTNYGGRIGNDGSFTVANVPPGRYTLRARSGGAGGRGNDPNAGRGGRGAARGQTGDPANVPTLLFASQPLSVGSDIADMTMTLAPGAKISGTVTLQLSQMRPAAQNGGGQNARVPDVSQIRVSTQPVDSSLGNAENARVDSDGTFALNNVPPGQHWLRAQAPRGLTLKSITVNGRDVTDDPTDVASGEAITGVSLIFTDKVTEVTGTITDSRSAPVTDFTVLAFPDDPALWRPQARQIMTTRPDQTGKYVLRGLPPGRYYLVTIDPASPGEWFDPAYLEARKDGAARFSLGDGEIKTQDFRLPAP